MNFCGRCGARLAEASDETELIRRYLPAELTEKILAARGRVEGERKQVTVLFADMKGYTPLAEALGEEAVYRLMERVYQVMITAVHECEGTVQELTGDGVLALFGAPVALEDAPVRACRAALAIQAGMRRLGDEVAAERGVRPEARIGIHTGPVVVGTVGTDLRLEFKAVGDTVNLAARLQTMAEPGRILISEATHRLVEEVTQVTSAGERPVKGKALPQRVFYLDGLAAAAARFAVAARRGLTPLVGREPELALLEGAWAEARGGAVRAVSVTGEAGIGKSRIVYELQGRLGADGPTFLQGHCTAGGAATSFQPFVEIVRDHLRLDEADAPPGIPTADLPFLRNLLGLEAREALRGLDGEIVGARTREALQNLLRLECSRGPAILFIDDLQWVDSGSQDLLERLVAGADALPLLIVGAFRPQYQPPWAGGANVTELRLEPLVEASALELVRRRLGTDVPDALASLIATKAEGNPLFAEEIARFFLEVGAGARIPGRLQDLIMARVDRLADGARAVLQAAAVIGRRFPSDLVRAVAETNGGLGHLLAGLQAQDILVGGGGEYAFKQALVQEAVYESLLGPRREELHRRTGEAIERLYGARLGEWAEALAHHWSRTSQTDKALPWLVAAGQKSLQVFALEEADARFRQAVELCADRRGPGALLADALLGWTRVHYYRKDFKGIVELVEKYRTRVEAAGDSRRLSLLLFWLGFSHVTAARFDAAAPVLKTALGLGEAVDDEECVGYAAMGLAYLFVFRPGDRPGEVVVQLAERSLAIAERRADVYLASKSLYCLILHQTFAGRLGEARRTAERLDALGRESADPRTTAMGLYSLAMVGFADERFDEAVAQADAALRLSPDPLDRLIARGTLGMALALGGRAADGLQALAEVRAELTAGGFLAFLLAIDVPYGIALALSGRVGEGVQWVEACIRKFEEWKTPQQRAFAHLVLGELYLQMVLREVTLPLGTLVRNLGFMLTAGPFAARRARRHLEAAAQLARDVGALGVLARSLLDLGLLARAQGRAPEARAHLEEAHGVAEPLEAPGLAERIRAALQSSTIGSST